MKIEIEIPDPPEGWQLDGYRIAKPNEKWWNGSAWVYLDGGSTIYAYPVAIKAKPLWTPSPELVAVLKPGWISMDSSGSIWLHHKKPRSYANDWNSDGKLESLSDSIKPELLPPNTIPWDKCCFRIGGDE
jgi:hypothetical protein